MFAPQTWQEEKASTGPGTMGRGTTNQVGRSWIFPWQTREGRELTELSMVRAKEGCIDMERLGPGSVAFALYLDAYVQYIKCADCCANAVHIFVGETGDVCGSCMKYSGSREANNQGYKTGLI
jgi:hypothetical protein